MGSTQTKHNAKGAPSSKRGSGQSDTVPVARASPFDSVISLLKERSMVDGQLGNLQQKVFVECLFTLPPEADPDGQLALLGSLWFQKAANGQGHEMDWMTFQKACERTHGIIDDQLALSMYLYLYASHEGSAGGDKREPLMPKESFEKFLRLSNLLYRLDSFQADETQTSANGDETQIKAIVNGLHTNSSRSIEVRTALKYIEGNLPNCTLHVHKFIVYRLVQGSAFGGVFTNRIILDPGDTDPSSFRQSLTQATLWQLSAMLPVMPYFKSPVEKQPSRRPSYYNLPISQDSQPIALAAWQLLYNSDAHGGGTNRFLHHVLGYRGPTVTLILAKESKAETPHEFVFAMTQEWRESVSTVFADKLAYAACLRPNTQCLARPSSTAWIYYNLGTMRGQKKGLILGETGAPFLILDDSFNVATYNKQALNVLRIEVWGTGSQTERTRQLDIKKWQIQQAEKQRVVKLSADDWLDHPDRYLLEMSGRTSYVTQKEKK